MDTDEFQEAVRTMIRFTGDADPLREGLADTPKRVHRAFSEWYKGYSQNPSDVLRVFKDGARDRVDEMVVVSNLPVFSQCEHHLAPFWGLAHVAYIPDGRILGLSKFPRLLDIFARRLQVQERLTNQVADALHAALKPLAAGVVLECRHMCMESRGVGARGAVTTTSALRGAFLNNPTARGEFFSLISSASHSRNGL